MNDLMRVADDLDASREQVVDALAREVEGSAERIMWAARDAAPVKTGALRDSITYDIRHEDAAVTADVGSDKFYSLFLEEGTSTRAPQPFLGPALDRYQDDFVDRVTRAVEDTL